jgi:hypothetical protein
MGAKRNITQTPVTPTELRRQMIMAWEEITKKLSSAQSDPNGKQVLYDTPAKPQVALLMSQWGAEQSGKTTFNFNLTGVKHPGPTKDLYSTDYFFAATVEVFDKVKAQGYVDRGGGLVEILEDDGVKMKIRFKPDHWACAFRSFNTLAEGSQFHVKNLRDNYNGAWTVLLSFTDDHNLGPLSAFTDRLAAKWYFTGSKATYLTNITKYYNEYFSAATSVWDEAYQFAEERRR